MSLERIPNKIIILIRRLSCNFIWNDRVDSHHFHLWKWQSIYKPRKAGGWGLKNLTTFNTALLACSFWRGVTHCNIWQKVVSDKYLDSLPPHLWLRRPSLVQQRASPFWEGLLSASPVVLHWLRWKPGTGTEILLGKDKILGLENLSILSPALRSFLALKGLGCLA
jgi:hypothetical protein